jgi:hypothetical protein
MKKFKDCKVITVEGHEKFEEEVRTLMKEGYEPVGSMQFSIIVNQAPANFWYSQLFVLYEISQDFLKDMLGVRR